jgi:hypothetical protein
MKIVNIDEILPQDKQFVLGGVTYTLPGSVPVRRMINLMRYGQALTDNPNDSEAFEGAIGQMVEIVAIKNPDIDREKIMDDLTPEAYQKIVELLYTQDKPDDEVKKA